MGNGQIPAAQVADLASAVDARIEAAPPELLVIDADQEFPPDGTPFGTVIYQRLS